MQALCLPKLMNVNPRSIFNKVDEFHTFVNEESIDCIMMSESWERPDKTFDPTVAASEYSVLVLKYLIHFCNAGLFVIIMMFYEPCVFQQLQPSRGKQDVTTFMHCLDRSSNKIVHHHNYCILIFVP